MAGRASYREGSPLGGVAPRGFPQFGSQSRPGNQVFVQNGRQLRRLELRRRLEAISLTTASPMSRLVTMRPRDTVLERFRPAALHPKACRASLSDALLP